jgi:hypothetical protein
MGLDQMKKEFPKQEQRLGVCYSQWRAKRESAKTHEEIKDVLELEGYSSEVATSIAHKIVP